MIRHRYCWYKSRRKVIDLYMLIVPFIKWAWGSSPCKKLQIHRAKCFTYHPNYTMRLMALLCSYPSTAQHSLHVNECTITWRWHSCSDIYYDIQPQPGCCHTECSACFIVATSHLSMATRCWDAHNGNALENSSQTKSRFFLKKRYWVEK